VQDVSSFMKAIPSSFHLVAELRSYIDKLPKNELALLCMGLYFPRGPAQVEHLWHFEAWQENQLSSKIIERAHHCSEAIHSLKASIRMISDKILCK